MSLLLAAGATYTLTAQAGSFTVTGQATDLIYRVAISAESGAFVITASSINFVYSRVEVPVVRSERRSRAGGEDAGNKKKKRDEKEIIEFVHAFLEYID